MARSYAVTWQQSTGSPHAGKLELKASAISLEGRNGGEPVSLLVPYRELLAVKVAPAPERLSGRPTLLLDRRGKRTLRIASVDAPGIILEVAEQVESKRTGPAVSVNRVAVVVPLREEKRREAELLLVQGPPFDPARAGLERHDVFLSDQEAIFVFEAVSEAGLQQLLTDARVWVGAAGWHDVVAGAPRVAKAFYAWETASPGLDDVFFGATPGPGDSDGGDIYSP